jgi:hypothetical protein
MVTVYTSYTRMHDIRGVRRDDGVHISQPQPPTQLASCMNIVKTCRIGASHVDVVYVCA